MITLLRGLRIYWAPRRNETRERYRGLHIFINFQALYLMDDKVNYNIGIFQTHVSYFRTSYFLFSCCRRANNYML